jgi:hypothetical protein
MKPLRGPGYNYTVVSSHRVLYLRVAKTATRSFSQWIGDGLPRARYRSSQRLPIAWDSRYFSFAVVRDPWDRLVSTWQNKVMDKPIPLFGRRMRFDDFVHFVAELDLARADAHVRHQTALLPDLALIDHLGRFEKLDATVDLVASKLDLDPRDFPRHNTSNATTGNYRSLYTPELAEVVARAFAPDVEAFGYEF